MQCDSKSICGWLQSLSQIAVAVVILYVGYIVNIHMEAWTAAFKQGSEDLHKMQQSMQSIEGRMKSIEERMVVVNQQMHNMNNNVGGMRRRMSPMGMFMPW